MLLFCTSVTSLFLCLFFFFSLLPPPCSSLFPYTTLFRSLFSCFFVIDEDVLCFNFCFHFFITFFHFVFSDFNIFRSCFFLRSEEHTSELQSRGHLVCRLLLEKKKRISLPCSTTSSFSCYI